MTGAAPIRVLLVEDHADSRAMYVEFLKDSFEIREASDGIQAWEALEREVPDVVVTDLSLPRLDGYGLIERIRGDERFRRLSIIALSGYTDPGDERAGWDEMLEKPCLPDSLSASIVRVHSIRKERL